MRFRIERARVLRAGSSLLTLLVLGCVGQRAAILESLLARQAVFLRLDWGPDPQPVFHEPVPERLVLRPSSDDPSSWPSGADLAGGIEVLDRASTRI